MKYCALIGFSVVKPMPASWYNKQNENRKTAPGQRLDYKPLALLVIWNKFKAMGEHC